MCTALIYSMIQHKRASHADIDLPFLVLGCVCVCLELHGHYLFRLCGSIIRISSTCYPGLRVCVFVCVCCTDLAPGVSTYSEPAQGGGRLLCACTETCPTPLHTHTSPHTSKGDGYRSVSDNQRVGEIPIPRYPLRLL